MIWCLLIRIVWTSRQCRQYKCVLIIHSILERENVGNVIRVYFTNNISTQCNFGEEFLEISITVLSVIVD